MVRKKFVPVILTLSFLLLLSAQTYPWGFFAHKKINRLAVTTLPTELMDFYKAHLDFITEHAIDPDKRRYGVDGEAPRHFIDIDHYSKTNPFEVVPRKWEDAVAKFSEDTLQAYGIVPWHIDKVMKRLTWAFKKKDLDLILRYSADLGHYVGDAHVPLHTTENYNGQLTGQKGIHGFWESRLPELKFDDYDFLVGRAEYVEKPLDRIWEAIEESHVALDSVLSFEKELSQRFPKDQKYGFENRGAVTVKVYSREYSLTYHDMLDGMVERRMRAAVKCLGDFWYTAWVNAGKPDLTDLNKKEVSQDFKKEIATEDASFKKGEIKGRKHDK